jgi:drug/metabolite transporter (DMT)-like permease
MASKPTGPTPETDSSPSGYLFASSSAATAGLATVIGKWNLEAVAPLMMNCFIFTIATVILSFWLLPRERLSRMLCLPSKGWWWLALFAISSWGAIYMFWAGVQKMDPTLAAFLHRSEVLVAILLAVVVLRERLNRWEIVGAAISIIGILIMRMTVRVEFSEGFWLVLGGSILFGLTELFSKLAVRYVEPVLLTYLRNLAIAGLYWLVFLGGTRSFEGLAEVWPGILALGLVGPILARGSYLLALKRMELTKVAVISQSQPIFVILIALLFLGQLPALREMVGGIVLTAGCLMMILCRRRR